MQIALLSPKGPLYRHRGGIFRKSLRYAPLTLTTLAALVPDDLHARVDLIDEGIRDVDPGLEADLVGMTVITGTARAPTSSPPDSGSAACRSFSAGPTSP